MKKVLIGIGCAVAAYAVMQFVLQHSSWQADGGMPEGDGPKLTQAAAAPQEPPAPFPEALAPLADGQPVPEAEFFQPSAKNPRIAVLEQWSGKLHRWHNDLPEDFRTEAVEETELVLIVFKQVRTHIDTAHYRSGPPVRRYAYDLRVQLLEAKSGEVLAEKCFFTDPPPPRRIEEFKLTELGDPVAWQPVQQWLLAEVARYQAPAKGWIEL
jgi:hypothetical protein